MKHILLSVISGWDVKFEPVAPVKPFALEKVAEFNVPALFYTIRVTGSKFIPTTVTGERMKSLNPWADVQVDLRQNLSIWNKVQDALERNCIKVYENPDWVKFTVGEWEVCFDRREKVFACNCPFYSSGITERRPRFCKHLIAALAALPELAETQVRANTREEYEIAVYYLVKRFAEQGWWFGDKIRE